MMPEWLAHALLPWHWVDLRFGGDCARLAPAGKDVPWPLSASAKKLLTRVTRIFQKSVSPKLREKPGWFAAPGFVLCGRKRARALRIVSAHDEKGHKQC